jgi:hypothetical protein
VYDTRALHSGDLPQVTHLTPHAPQNLEGESHEKIARCVPHAARRRVRLACDAELQRGPVFRANKEQIKQAQAILKQRGFYAGDETGKLDPETRAGLKKYQEAEQLKVTGTLNKATLEKMNVTLTDKQKEWKPAA